MKIPFDTAWNKVAVSVSGGADSAMLAYLICEKISFHRLSTEMHLISHVRCWKSKPWQQYDSDQVYRYLESYFPNITFRRHQNFIAPELEYANIGASLVDEYGKQVSGDNIEQRAFAEYICCKYDIPVYFNGVTKNPKELSEDGMKERNIVKTEDNKHLEYMHHMGKIACHPFRFVDKSAIVQEYVDRNLIDFFNQTRSCEGTFDGIDYTTYAYGQSVPTCGKCFWCKEREWAVKNVKY